MGWLVAPIANLVPSSASVRILQGPARGLRWIAGSGVPNYWLGTYERNKVREFSSLLRSDSVVYDIGAHAGYYSLIAARTVK